MNKDEDAERRSSHAGVYKAFEPGKIGTMELKNRVIYPPMVTHLVSEEGHITDRQIDYYVERARGGAGLIVIESGYPRSTGYPHRIMLGNDKVILGLRKLVEAIHREGAKTVFQVNTHRGRGDEVDPLHLRPSLTPLQASSRDKSPLKI